MYVENFCEVKNQFVIYTKKAVIFQSYKTTMAVYLIKTAEMYVREEKYSYTTSKYTNRFLKEYPDAEVKYVNSEAFDVIMREI